MFAQAIHIKEEETKIIKKVIMNRSWLPKS
jgi:hypothetical protein